MNTADLANGGFEAFGAFALFGNVRRILRDKQIRGIDPKATVFFTSWGLWNLYYYPSLDQWASFAGGCAIVCMNAAWLALAFRYRSPRHESA